MNTPNKACDPRPFWPPLVAGVALGMVLLLTFLLTGHGLGATGFFTRLAAWTGGELAFDATYNNVYLGPLLDDGKPMSSWITWQIIGVALGALAASWSTGRFRVRLDGTHKTGPVAPSPCWAVCWRASEHGWRPVVPAVWDSRAPPRWASPDSSSSAPSSLPDCW